VASLLLKSDVLSEIVHHSIQHISAGKSKPNFSLKSSKISQIKKHLFLLS
jgi:hypothetical protein